MKVDNNSKRQILPSLKINFSWTLFGNLVYAFTQWAVISLIARLGNVEMVGQYTLALAITAPVYLFFQMNLRSIQATDRVGEFELNEYIGFRLITLLFTTSIVLIILIFGDFNIEMLWLVLFIGIAKSSELISEVYYGNFQKNEIMKYVAVSKIVRGIFSAIILGIILFTTNSIVYATLAFSLSWILTLWVVDIRLTKSLINHDNYKKIIKPYINLRIFKSIIIIALPLGIAGALDSFNTNIPRYLISFYLGEASLGYFAAIAYIIVAGHTVIGALCHAAIPRLAKYYHLGKINNFKTLLFKLNFIGALIGAFAILVSVFFGDTLLKFIYTEDFGEYHNILIIVVGGGVIWYMVGFLNTAILASRKFKLQVPILLLSACTTLVTSWILIPELELVGAGYSLIAGFSARFIISLYYVIKLIKEKSN
ncbi:oligosaccharide flippase family protein [Alkalicoccus saliphilus]|uniref:Polysaccharide biosynthesis protein n=1 Tax=Alkalicoccus saliphilus TaxID=200989 RepID=A0A2T4U3H4_9BACI|nr:oligosaccharide flippase family protein [Alkalicoccus saliphilus]PTL37905.1 polysaccharide biosynthesis protein [Alkalicoccus saliphilus]